MRCIGTHTTVTNNLSLETDLESGRHGTCPKEAELLRKSFYFLRRKDVKKISQITSNHMICSVHFQGYCKADPVPTIYNDPAMVLPFNANTIKCKEPRSQSPSVEVRRRCNEEVSKVTSTTTNSERDEFLHLEPLAVENGDEHSAADFLVQDFASAVQRDHNYLSVNVQWEHKLF